MKLSFVQTHFADYPARYWIAGGWALDLFDRVRRPHTDVDVLVLARDLDRVAQTFTDPRPTVENPNTGEQRPWESGETLTPGPDILAFPDDLFPATAPHHPRGLRRPRLDLPPRPRHPPQTPRRHHPDNIRRPAVP